MVGTTSTSVGVTGDPVYPERAHERLADRAGQDGRELPRDGLRARHPHLEAPPSHGLEHSGGDLLGRHDGKGTRAGLSLQHRRLDLSRLDDRERHAAAPILEAERLGEADDAVLGGRIGRVPGRGTRPAAEATLTIWPSPRGSMSASASFEPRAVP
jgi:hypothetical protein